MKTPIGNWLTAFAVLGMTLPTQAFAESPAKPAPPAAMSDVSLSANGDLAGAVITRNGKPAAAATVQVLHGRNLVAEVKTDQTGRYRVQGLRDGVHIVRTAGAQQACRFWTGRNAPPSATRGVLLTTHSTVVRGQDCYNGDCGEACEYINEGCNGNCRGGCNGQCGSGGGLLSGGSGTLLALGAFGAVAAVTIASATQDDNRSVRAAPASP